MPTTPDTPLVAHKLFNCIVDDTALIAGLKKSTRDGITKWVNNESIRLFVPLHTLERLRRLQNTSERVSTDAKDALKWLDDTTDISGESTNSKIASLVNLQGGFQEYERWEQVEEFLLPQTLLSMETETNGTDKVTVGLADLHIDAIPDQISACSQASDDGRTSSPISAYSSNSPRLLHANPYNEAKLLPQPIGTGRPSHKKSASNISAASTESIGPKPKRTVPLALRPFFNYILWRIHQEEDPAAAIETFILVTNDPLKQQIAQRFGIRVKRLEQLREIIAREERDIKNRKDMLRKELAAEALSKKTTPQQSDDDDDEIVLKRTPPTAPQAMTNGRAVFDPNAFGRTTNSPARGTRGGFRGRGGPVRGNYAPRAIPPAAPRAQAVDLTKPIDPDSFNRAPAVTRVARGGRRRLWEPA